jgi:hypothetical protein
MKESLHVAGLPPRIPAQCNSALGAISASRLLLAINDGKPTSGIDLQILPLQLLMTCDIPPAVPWSVCR